MSDDSRKFDAWNPGLDSKLPEALLPLVTLYRPETSTVGYAEARQAADFCGRKPEEMVAFTAARLVRHELLIRLMADINVPDGPDYPELGENLRRMAERILTVHIQPHMPRLEQEFARLRERIEQKLASRLEQDIDAKGAGKGAGGGLMARLGKPKPKAEGGEPPEIEALLRWQDELARPGDAFELACLRGLQAIVGGIVGQRGRLFADRDLVLKWAADRVCNGYGSTRIGQMIQPMIREAVAAEGYRVLPFQSAPVFMSVKGGPGAGKSTLRPLQKELADRLGLPWRDFALISPDYCRKFLLDYDSLGAHRKYAAALTGQELDILDKKIDHYMEQKAMRSEMPHVLVDRFRFDSFVPAPFARPGGTLLSRFADTVYLFFMITPPEQAVERVWQRGLKTGRYKALDDILHFTAEANVGMPQLFFSWVRKTNQKIHFEFLDNAVPEGERPRTAAFGWNGSLTVLDGAVLRSMDRNRALNIEARSPEQLFPEGAAPSGDFLARCIEEVGTVTFLDPGSLEVLGQTRGGACTYQKDGFFAEIGLEDACRRGAGKTAISSRPEDAEPVDIEAEHAFTLGAWGGRDG